MFTRKTTAKKRQRRHFLGLESLESRNLLSGSPWQNPLACNDLDDDGLIVDQLQEALNSRVVIEQAKGIMAERLGLGVDEAFTRLRRYARHSGRRLGEVAQEAIDGTLHFEEILTTPSRCRC
jgi:hypothetical protein